MTCIPGSITHKLGLRWTLDKNLFEHNQLRKSLIEMADYVHIGAHLDFVQYRDHRLFDIHRTCSLRNYGPIFDHMTLSYHVCCHYSHKILVCNIYGNCLFIPTYQNRENLEKYYCIFTCCGKFKSGFDQHHSVTLLQLYIIHNTWKNLKDDCYSYMLQIAIERLTCLKIPQVSQEFLLDQTWACLYSFYAFLCWWNVPKMDFMSQRWTWNSEIFKHVLIKKLWFCLHLMPMCRWKLVIIQTWHAIFKWSHLSSWPNLKFDISLGGWLEV